MKIVSEKEILEIIADAIQVRLEAPGKKKMLRALADIITLEFGGIVHSVSDDVDNDGMGLCVAVKWDDDIPEDGGIWGKYDPDVTLQEWKEEARAEQKEE